MSQSKSPSAALLCAVALLSLATACAGADSTAATDTPRPPTGTASSAQQPTTTSTTAITTASTTRSATGGRTTSGADATRCHTSELRASVGRNNPGAGQENFPIVLTNVSSSACTLYGFPGAAFVDASGKQLGPDPKRASDSSPTSVTLAPGRSAWAGLTFANPEVSEARTATPASLVVTPPDERDPLTVGWTGGKVPVAGNASSVFLTTFSSGTGA
ncbi:DUF4232 domain-containing protein [Streptomyces sp. NPDC002928]|uniref:DUF4232 domain-containing protein n=1 Tax=Streptomyces sp. NPDC002928 TaxID=3154440 RepID=UPI0033B7932C